MKRRVVCVFVLFTLFALLVSGCSSGAKPEGEASSQATTAPTQAKGVAAEATTAPSATPVPTAEPTSAPAEDEDSEEIMFSDLNKLDHLNSYRVQTIVRWEDTDGEAGSMDLTIEFTRDPLAQRMIVSNSENDIMENVEMISIGDTMYMKVSDDEWIALQSADTSVDEMGQIWAPADFLAGGDAQYMGTETINGLETKHYRYKEQAFVPGAGFSAIDKAEGNVWVSTRYNVYVKAILRVEGQDEDGVKGTFEMESYLTDINTPITISAPAGVAKPGLPDDIPLMEGATEVSAFGQIVSFTVASPVSDVIEYYKTQMKDNGWTMEESIVDEMQNYTKGDRSATIMISEADEGSSSVVIMVEQEAAE